MFVLCTYLLGRYLAILVHYVHILCYMLCVIVLCHARINRPVVDITTTLRFFFVYNKQASKQVEIDPTAVCDEGKLH